MRYPLARYIIFFSLLISSFVLHASESAAIANGTQWLLAQQRSDGSWGDDVNTRYMVTAEAVNALLKTAQRNNAYYKGISWLQNHASQNTDYSSRKIQSLSYHGDILTSSYEYLSNNQDNDTTAIATSGWGVTGQYRGSNLDTALALLAQSYGSNAAVQAAPVNFLISNQINGNGGWSLSNDTTPDAFTTAVVLRALSRLENLYGSITSSILSNAAISLDTLQVTSTPRVRALIALALEESNQGMATKTAIINSLVASFTMNDFTGMDVAAVATALQAIGVVNGYADPSKTNAIAFSDNQVRTGITSGMDRNLLDDISVIEAESFEGSIIVDSPDDITDLSYFPNAKTLIITGNTLANVGTNNFLPIKDLVNLETLVLAGTGISVAQASAIISHLTNLKYLDLTGLAFNSTADLMFLEDLDNLETLIFYSPASVYASCFGLTQTGDLYGDVDSDGADDCEEYTATTNIWNANSKPQFVRSPDINNAYYSMKGADFFDFKDLSGLGWNDVLDGWHAAWADLDADADPDLIVYVHGAGEQWDTLSCDYDCGGDYDGDWNGKLLFYEYDDVNKTFIRNTSVVDSTPNGSTMPDDRPAGDIFDIYFFDFDSDGDKDVLLSTYELNLYENKGNMNFDRVTEEVGLLGELGFFAQILDVNMDGHNDIFLTTREELFVYEPHDPANPASPLTGEYVNQTGAISSHDWGTVFGTLDIDNDKKIDLVSFTGGSNPITVHLNASTGGNIAFNSYPLSADNFPGYMATYNWQDKAIVEDYDKDDDFDLIVFETRIIEAGPWAFDYAGTAVRFFRNDTLGGIPSFVEDTSKFVEHPGGYNDFYRGGAVLDMNNDGFIDLLKSEKSLIRTRPLINDGNQFILDDSKRSGITVGTNKYPMTAPLDSDGDVDLFIPKASGYGAFHLEPLENLESIQGVGTSLIGNNGFFVRVIGDPKGISTLLSTKDAYGAKVTVTYGMQQTVRQVLPKFGEDNLLHFGIGAETSATIDVVWPSGLTDSKTINNLADSTTSKIVIFNESVLTSP